MKTTLIKSNRLANIITVAALALIGAAGNAAANNELWQGVSGTSTTTNWSDNANWLQTGTGGAGPNGNDTVFGDGGAVGTAGTVNSVVDNSSLDPFSLTFTNQSQSPNLKFHTILIPASIGMTNANGLTVGANSAVNGYLTVVNFVGAGTFAQNGANVTVKDISSATSSGATATLDLSGLSNFVYNASAGTLAVAGSGSDARGGGVLNLAGGTNTITVGTFTVATGSGNGGAGGTVNLGAGTNIINVGTVNLASGKINTATVEFLGATGGLRLRGVGGTDADRATFTLGNRSSSGTGNAVGTLNFSGGHSVDIKAATMTLGKSSQASLGSGVLSFDTGTVDVTNLNLAVCSLAGGSASGAVTVGGSAGTLVIGTGGLSLANQTAGASTGNLYDGGSVTCSGNIFKTTLAGTGSITITNGSLTMASGKTIGTAAIPIDNVNLTSATLQLSVVNNSTNVVASALDLVDSANTVNIAALPVLSGYPGLFPIFSYASFPGGGTVNLGTLPGTYLGYLSNDTASVIWLVVTNGPSTSKMDEWGGGVNNNWDKTSLNWTNAGVAVTYVEADSVTFDDLAQASTVNLTATRAPLNLTVTNNTLNYTFNGSGSITGAVALVKQGAASLTLAETGGDNFSGGVTVGAGTVILDDTNCAISGGVTISSGATMQIGINDSNGALPSGSVDDEGALIFSHTNSAMVATAINGAGSLTATGIGKLTLSNTNGYAGNTFVGNGTLALSGTGAISNSTQVVFSNATFDVSGASGQTVLNNLNLTNSTIIVAMPNLQPPVSAASLDLGGSGNTVNFSSLPPIASYPSTITIVQTAGAISGFNMSAGTFPTASPAYAGSVALSGDTTAVLLTLTSGPVGVRPNVTWSGVDALGNLNTNWSDRLNWQLPGAPGTADNVIFNSTATAANGSDLSTPGGGASALIPENINNFVDTNFTIASLTYTNNGGSYHNTAITNGATLNVTNFFTVGTLDTTNTAQLEYVNIAGAQATLNVNNTNANLQVWLGSGSAVASQATLDLSALDNFTANISRLTVGASAVNNAVNRPSGILYLARTNTINCAFQTTTSESGTTTGNSGIVVSDCNQNNGSTSYIYLGQVNTISADTIGIARQKTSANILFNPVYTNVAPYPTVTFKGFSSSLVSVFDIGDAIGNTGTTAGTGDLNLNGGLVTAAVDTMNIGRASGATTGTGLGTSTGSMEFDAGTITVNTLNLGLQPAGTGLKSGVGTVTVNLNPGIGAGATLTVRSNLNLAASTSGAGAASTTGTLNIINATVLAGAIVAGTNGSTSTINLSGGTLVVTNTAGTPAAPLTTLSLDGGMLQLNLNGSSGVTNVVATTINTNNPTILKLGAIANVTTATTYPLISYTGNDPYGTFTLVLPSGYAGTLVDDTADSLISLTFTTIPNPQPPVINSVTAAGGYLVFSGTNGLASGPYYVLTSTNLTLPRTNWTRIATNYFTAGGNFSVTNTINPALPQQFYIISQ